MNGLIFTYLLTYGGALIALFNPYYGLLIYILFAVIKPPALWPWCVPPGSYSKIIGVAFLIGWAMNGFGNRSLGKAKPIAVCFIGYFTWVVLSSILSPDPGLGGPFIEYLIKILLPFVAGITLIHTRQQLSELLFVILGGCAFLAYEANLAHFHGFDFEHDSFFDLDNNSFSILMMASFGLALILGLEERVLWRRFAFLGVAAAMAHVPMFGYSRGGMMGGLAAAIVAAVVIPKTPRTWIMLVTVALIGARLVGPSVIAEFDTSFNEGAARDYSAESRLDLWHDCTVTMLMHPFFGCGQERWGIVAEDFGWTRGKEAHSLWFQTAAELGIPGVGFLMGLYLLPPFLTWRASRKLDVPWLPTFSRMILVSITGFVVSASFVTVEGFELPFYIVLLAACGLNVAYAEAEARDSLREHAHDWNDLPLPAVAKIFVQ